MYGAAGSSTYAATHANTNKSLILTYLETWYTSKLSSYASSLADTIWCNDKKTDTIYPYGTTLGYGTNQTGYSARGRIYANDTYTINANPSLVCQNDTNGGKLSKFTADETTYGNGNLTYKIGLLTADEVAYAGAIFNAGNSSYYLYKNASSTDWWTLSPVDYAGTGANVWYTRFSGYIWSNLVGNTEALRPAVSLVSTTQVIGAGTLANPYVVQ